MVEDNSSEKTNMNNDQIKTPVACERDKVIWLDTLNQY